MNGNSNDSLDAQYAALVEGNGFVRLDQWSQMTITGADRKLFLHNLCTNDIKHLAPGQKCEAFFVDVKGKIIGHGLIVARDDRLELLMVPGQAAVVMAHLDRYVIREDVVLRDETERFDWFYLSGENAIELRDLGGFAVSAESLWPGGLFVQCDEGERARVEAILIDAGRALCEPAIGTAVRIESGLPLFGVDFDGANLPQEVDRDAMAVSFTKGCYLGQETIARIDALGHVNQKSVLIQFAGAKVPDERTKLTVDGAEVGKVTSACWSPRFNSPVALAMVRRGANDLGAQIKSELGPAVVIAAATSAP